MFPKIIRERKFLVGVFLLSLTPLIWFRPWDTLITGGDFWIPVSPLNFFKVLLSPWLANVSGGQVNNSPFEIFPWVGFWAILRFFNLPLTFIEKAWFVSIFFTGSFSMYLLTSEIFGNKKENWKNFLPSVLYLFNLYIMLAGTATTSLLVYILSPLLTLLYIKGSKSPETLKASLRLALASVFLTSAAGNPPIYSVPFVLFLLYFCYLLVNRRVGRLFLKFNLQFFFFYLLFNIWWLYFYLTNLSHQIGIIKEVTGAAVVGSGSALFDLVRLLGSWAFFAGHKGAPYFPFAFSYLNPFLMFLTFLIPVLAFAGFYFLLKENRFPVSFFAFAALISLLLSHGQSDDFLGKVNLLIRRVIPVFWIYREPFAKFSLITALSYSILLGGLFHYLELRIKSSLRLNILGFATLILILVVAWPIVAGAHFPDKRGLLAPMRTKIPRYWFEAADWFRGKENEGRVLILPDNPDANRSGIPYAWGYDSADIVPHLLPVPWVERNNGFYVQALMENVSEVSGIAYRTIHESYLNPGPFTQILSILNVRRILQRNDIDLARIENLSENYSPRYVKERLARQDNVEFERSFGHLDVYKVRADVIADKIYVPEKTVCISGDVRKINYPLALDRGTREVAVFSESGTNGQKEEFNSQLCPSHYIVPVEVLKKGSVLSSAPYKSSFDGVKVNFSEKIDPVETEEPAGANERRFLFKVSRAGAYDLYYEGTISPEGKRQFPNISIRKFGSAVDLPVVLQPKSSILGLDSVGGYSLEEGIYLLKFTDPAPVNLIENSSFETATWKSSLSLVPPPFSSDSYEGGKSMSLGFGQTDAYYNISKEDLKNEAYEISFFYKVNAGIPPRFVTWENNCPVAMPIWTKFDSANNPSCLSSFSVGQALKEGSGWTEYRMDFVPDLKAERLGIGFVYLDKDLRAFSSEGETLIDDVSIRPKNFGGVVLKMDVEKERPVKPEVSIFRRSPTDYSLAVTSARKPFYLVFSETYNEDWQAFVRKGDRLETVPSERHFIVNGYANSWYLDNIGDYEVEIKYRPERLFKILLSLSVLSIVSSLAFLQLGLVKQIGSRKTAK